MPSPKSKVLPLCITWIPLSRRDENGDGKYSLGGDSGGEVRKKAIGIINGIQISIGHIPMEKNT